MNAKQKFITMFNWLSEGSRRDLVFKPYGSHPMSLNVIYWEVNNDTDLGKKCLLELGYEDDAIFEIMTKIHAEVKNV